MKRKIKATRKTKRRVKNFRKTRKDRKRGGLNAGFLLLMAIPLISAFHAGRQIPTHGKIFAVNTSADGGLPPFKPPKGFKIVDSSEFGKNSDKTGNNDNRLESAKNFFGQDPVSLIHGLVTRSTKETVIPLDIEEGPNRKLKLVRDPSIKSPEQLFPDF